MELVSPSKRYQKHLDEVSRSFAFCIAELREPLREWVGLSYLLCRYVDTVEDAPWATAEARRQAFDRLQEWVNEPVVIRPLLELEASLLALPIEDGERDLVMAGRYLMTDLRRLPERVRKVLEKLIWTMIKGMGHFAQSQNGTGLRLKSLSEVNQYCFFVAGIVGEMLAELLVQVAPHFELKNPILRQAHHFGLFLQKVNLIKDQYDDQSAGRELLPDRRLVESSALRDADQAFSFLCSIPSSEVEFRRFCGWSLFLGLESLRVCLPHSSTEAPSRKVSRSFTLELLSKVSESLEHPNQLNDLYRQARTRVEDEPLHIVGSLAGPSRGSLQGPPEWLMKIYVGPLTASDLNALGLCAD